MHGHGGRRVHVCRQNQMKDSTWRYSDAMPAGRPADKAVTLAQAAGVEGQRQFLPRRPWEEEQGGLDWRACKCR